MIRLTLFLFIAPLLVACRPESLLAAESTATLPPPIVEYATITFTPTATYTPSFTPTASQTPITPTATNTPVTPTATRTPTSTNTATPTPTAFPTHDANATHTPVPTYAALSAPIPEHFWLGRPIPEDFQNIVEANYRYGETRENTLPPHHGVEFYNPTGTPIIAAAGGEVVFAGPDWDVVFGPNAYFYGNLVVIKLDRVYLHQPVYTLYAHMDTIAVETGQRVEAAQALGSVGGSGVALGGAHLHFEVRVGFNHYESTRNPELWLQPFPRWGALAGRVVDPDGRLVPLANITIRSVELLNEDIEGPINRFLYTYAAETINPDEQLGENFAISDLPPGTYQVSVSTGRSSKKLTVEIERDQLAWVEFEDVLPNTRIVSE